MVSKAKSLDGFRKEKTLLKSGRMFLWSILLFYLGLSIIDYHYPHICKHTINILCIVREYHFGILFWISSETYHIRVVEGRM